MGVASFGQAHVARYRETDGEEGNDWQATPVLLLTTAGRNSGARRTTPLIYNGTQTTTSWWPPTAAAIHPAGFSTFRRPIVAVQVKADHHIARARRRHGRGEADLWRIMTATGAPYDEVQAKADREIPVVVLEPG
ncbi:MAG TPA: nitroreductase/quinone reductase family protein [Solirubrobacteraceae bacterium]|nr:nitroreductase/quinone reductase family protein [Solirubrobacteraceae bacterium]